MKIAFVEDDRDWSSAICEILEFDGHEILPFDSPNIPYEIISSFDMVICDNKINEIDSGIRYISKLRHSGFEGLLLLYTSFPRPQLEEQCDSVDAYLVNKVDDISFAVSKILDIEKLSHSHSKLRTFTLVD